MTAPYRQVIVGTDGSPTADRAVRAAAQLAHACGSTMVIATAWYRDPHETPSRAEQATYGGATPASHEASWANETVADAAAIARELGVEDVRVLTPTGGPADALVKLGDQYPDSLVVVGTVGLPKASERLLGNVPHQLTHHSARDVFLVSHADPDLTWKRVALATDGSRTAAVAVQRGADLATAIGADITLLTVARNEAHGKQCLDEAAEALGRPDAGRAIMPARHDVATDLTDAARDFDLLVIGNKGMSGPSRLLGSVSNKVTHAVPTDILLVNTTR